MLGGLFKAVLLEFNGIKESKINLLLLLVAPALLMILFSYAGSTKITGFDFTYYRYLFPLLAVTILLFVSTQQTVLRIAGERKPYGALDRDLLAVSRPGMYLGKFVANAIIAFVYVLFLFLAVVTINPINILGNPVIIFVFLFLASLFGISLGLFVSVVSPTKEFAVQIIPYFVLGLFILTPYILPMNVLSGQTKFVVENSPINLSYQVVERTIVESGITFSVVFSELLRLIGWILLLLGMGVIKFLLEKRE